MEWLCGGKSTYLVKITKIGEIKTTKEGKVVSVTAYDWFSEDHRYVWKPIELCFWNNDAEKISKYPIGTTIHVEGSLNCNKYIIIPVNLKEIMNAGKYKGKGLTYFEVLKSDREYINQLVVSEKTPEKWKLKLIDMTKAYDDWKTKVIEQGISYSLKVFQWSTTAEEPEKH